MGLFGKREEVISDKSEEYVLKEELETEVENIQKEFRTKQDELNEITQKIKTVKEEYNYIISNLMVVKKELNLKKMELDVAQREHGKISKKIKNYEQITDSKSVSEFSKTKGNFSKIKQELEKVKKEHEEINEQILQKQSLLHGIKNQQIEYEKELDEARSRLYNAKEELEKKDHFQDTSILTPKEKEFIQGENSNQKSSAGVIEAASAVVGSLKSKLNMTQKELESLQLLLEKEREEHEKTKKELKKLKESTKSLK
jgi:predicted  nucleic acid-binding Zn-ribbon protein